MDSISAKIEINFSCYNIYTGKLFYFVGSYIKSIFNIIKDNRKNCFLLWKQKVSHVCAYYNVNFDKNYFFKHSNYGRRNDKTLVKQLYMKLHEPHICYSLVNIHFVDNIECLWNEGNNVGGGVRRVYSNWHSFWITGNV